MIRNFVQGVRARRAWAALPEAARAEARRDRQRGLGEDPGREWTIARATEWLLRAQRNSRTADGGFARHFSLVDGWAPSYPETTGYIAPTLILEADACGDTEIEVAARRALDWLVSIQMENGAFQGGVIGAEPVKPVTFNTGQILIGLAHGAARYGEPYLSASRRAADWLVQTQDADGAWRSHPTPFAKEGEKTYETHVSWGLLEAARVEPDRGYAESALRQVRWAIRHQRQNGWFELCCLDQPHAPLTHTIGYAFRGVLEAYRYSGERDLLVAAQRTGDGVLGALHPNGFIAGRLDAEWNGMVDWACLTGTVQIAACWLLLWRQTEDARYLAAAQAANRYVRRTIRAGVGPDQLGAVKGSFPVDGAYGRFEFLSWGPKFLIDALRIEEEVLKEATQAPDGSRLVPAKQALHAG